MLSAQPLPEPACAVWRCLRGASGQPPASRRSAPGTHRASAPADPRPLPRRRQRRSNACLTAPPMHAMTTPPAHGSTDPPDHGLCGSARTAPLWNPSLPPPPLALQKLEPSAALGRKWGQIKRPHWGQIRRPRPDAPHIRDGRANARGRCSSSDPSEVVEGFDSPRRPARSGWPAWPEPNPAVTGDKHPHSQQSARDLHQGVRWGEPRRRRRHRRHAKAASHRT